MGQRSRLINGYRDEAQARRHWWREFGDTVLVWHFRSFAYEDEGIDEMMARAASHKALIIDLRDNGGGALEAIRRLIGHFIHHPQRISRLRRPNKTDSLVAEPARNTPFPRNLIVLLNANPASASDTTTR